MEHVIGNKFKLGRKIGSGSFGELYLGTTLFLFCFLFWSFCFSVLLGIDIVGFVSEIWGFVIVGVNVQTGEEVAVKLVCCVL